jgi:hypothetical protein
VLTRVKGKVSVEGNGPKSGVTQQLRQAIHLDFSVGKDENARI